MKGGTRAKGAGVVSGQSKGFGGHLISRSVRLATRVSCCCPVRRVHLQFGRSHSGDVSLCVWSVNELHTLYPMPIHDKDTKWPLYVIAFEDLYCDK